MIQFVWIIIQDIPVSGMRFIKSTDQEERERLEKFYGWLGAPITEFTEKVQDIIIEGTKYYYHVQNSTLFVVGVDLDETSIPSIFLPELESQFFNHFNLSIISSFNGKDITPFRSFDNKLLELVKAFGQRKIEAKGNRKDLDAFEVLNLPSDLQMVALVLVKMQVVTPEMVSQVTGLSTNDVERQLRDIYQRGYLYITIISNKSYFSIKPFESENGSKIITQRTAVTTDKKQVIDSQRFETTPTTTETPVTLPSYKAEKQSKIDITQAEINPITNNKDFKGTESAMMAPPDWEAAQLGAESSFRTLSSSNDEDYIISQTQQIDKISDELTDSKESKGIKMKIDPIARDIDRSLRTTIVIPKNGFLPVNSLRRERGFITGKIRIPSEKNKDPFLLNSLFKKDIENLFEALFIGDFIVLASDKQTLFEDELVDQLFEIMNMLTPHRELKFVKTSFFVHPKDADVIAVHKDLLKYYSWATILDLDTGRIVGGTASEYSKNFVKKIKRISDPKEFLHEITNTTSILLKIGRDINTLKIEGRSPDQYLNEVRKVYGAASLDIGLTLSERLIRLHKDCAYIAGFYIRKGLEMVVRAVLLGEPIVVIGDNPMDVYHIIEALSIFAPNKAINAQIWTTNLAEINIDEFNIMGAQEGTDRLFKGAIRVNLRSMSAYGGQHSEFLHNFLRQMWHRRSKERPKFIRENIIEMITNANKIILRIQAFGDRTPTKQEIKDIFNDYEPFFAEFVAEFIHKDHQEIALTIKNLI
ncbi:MAG: hypothetical protein JXA54_14815 [Candidatus Heimdallarchaeota archaeon]|nr:hypothetical protein [Candidatus Heimdallarchaeota archaeon]